MKIKLILCTVLFAFFTTSCVKQSRQKKRPNILIAISDDQSYPHTSASGSTFVNTPIFDRIADSGILFTNAFVTSPGCAPSRASLVMGRYPWQNEHAGNHTAIWPKKLILFPDLLDLPKTQEGEEQAVGLNFCNISLPPKIEIVSAYIQFVSSPIEMKNTERPSMNIWVEAVDNSSPFVAQDNNVSKRLISEKGINWRPPRWKRKYREGANQQTAYLNNLIQDIVDSPGWASCNSISFIIKRADDEVGGTKYRLAMNYPELVINFIKCIRKK